MTNEQREFVKKLQQQLADGRITQSEIDELLGTHKAHRGEHDTKNVVPKIRKKSEVDTTKVSASKTPHVSIKQATSGTNLEPRKTTRATNGVHEVVPIRTGRMHKPEEPKKYLSDEELKRIRSQASKKAWKTKVSSMTPEELEEWKRKQSERMHEGMKNKRANMTEAEKAKQAQKDSARAKKAMNKRLSKMTPEELEEWKRKQAENLQKGMQKKLAEMTPEELEEYKQNQVKKMQEGMRKKREAMLPEELAEWNTKRAKRARETRERNKKARELENAQSVAQSDSNESDFIPPSDTITDNYEDIYNNIMSFLRRLDSDSPKWFVFKKGSIYRTKDRKGEWVATQAYDFKSRMDDIIVQFDTDYKGNEAYRQYLQNLETTIVQQKDVFEEAQYWEDAVQSLDIILSNILGRDIADVSNDKSLIWEIAERADDYFGSY